MLLPGTYANGFAPRDGSPLYPELWRGCVGAWNPGLGVSGLTLRDQSGFQNNGTLTNGPTFAASQGKYALSFDGTDDYVDCGTNSSLRLEKNVSISLWIKLNSVYNVTQNMVSNINAGGIGCNYLLEFGRTTNKISWIQNGGSVDVIQSGTISDNNSHHISATRFGSTGSWEIKIYVDGLIDSTTTTSVNPGVSPGILAIGRTGSYPGQYFNGQIDDVRIYNRALSAREIRTLATRRGIAYEMAPRRRSSVQVTTNRRRRIIIGGNR